MGARDRKSAADPIINLIRRITRIVQLVPFVYLCFYAVYMIGSTFLPDGILCVADSLMVSSPLATGGMLVASRLLKLCRWHKAACLIPSTSQVEGYVDSFVIQFTQNEIVLINSIIGVAVAVADSIGSALGGETPAYISGDIARALSDIICRFGCGKCRCRCEG